MSHPVKVKLIGSKSDFSGIGSRVNVFAKDIRMIREIDGGSSHESQNSTIAHFGMNELNTAAYYSIPAVWIVLNDACYGMVHHGMHALGYKNLDFNTTIIDFAKFANDLGIDSVRLENESNIEEVLEMAVNVNKPFLIDVIVDRNEVAPFN